MANADLNTGIAPVEQRVLALHEAFLERGLTTPQAVEDLEHKAQEEWLPRNGARVVARAWSGF